MSGQIGSQDPMKERWPFAMDFHIDRVVDRIN
jgi:hypothetical protein